MNKTFKKLFIFLTLILIFPLHIFASSASINVSSSVSKVVVGKTFNVTVKISSSEVLGSWEWTIEYDKSKFKLLSGQQTVADYGNGSKKSSSYTYSFKAIASGSGNISVKSYGGYTWNENKLNISKNTKTIKVITQSELEASYSKNNNLSHLEIKGYKIEPDFDKNVTEYKATVDANTEEIEIDARKDDSRAIINGEGKKNVTEGENKFEITITAENGSTKTYTVIVNVTDPNPIEININDQKYVIVKRESNLEAPANYESKEIQINDTSVPALYNELNDITLVGLKDSEGNINLYIYDEKENKYTKYSEVILSSSKILPLNITTTITGYKKDKVTINDVEYEALTNNSDYVIIYARDLETGRNDYYMYDTVTKTAIRYDKTTILDFEKKLNKNKKIIMLLLIETLIMFIIVISLLISNLKRKNKIKREKQKRLEKEEKLIKEKENKIKEEKIKNDEKEENKKNDNIEIIKKTKTNTRKKKKNEKK